MKSRLFLLATLLASALFCLTGRAEAGTYWSSIAAACAPESASIQADRYVSSPDSKVAPKTNNVDPVVLICHVPVKQGVTLPTQLGMTYLDTTGTATTAAVQVQLIRVNRASGGRSVVATVSSNTTPQQTATAYRKSQRFTQVNFETFYYYVRIDIDRSATTQIVQSIGVVLEFPTLASIAVTPANSTVNIGHTKSYTATATYSDGSTSNVTSSAVWTSSNEAFATIDTSGLATGLAAGNTTISASVDDLATGSTTLTVVPDVCGDSIIGVTEQCDDGGTLPGDGCSNTCTVESGFSCTGEPSVCVVNPVLSVTTNGSGTGTVTSDPAGINCPGDCDEAYAPNTVVTLTATPSGGNMLFTGWSGACTGFGSCVVTMSIARSVNANFTEN